MKILVVTTEYGKDSTGGVESVVSFLLKAIDELTDWDAQVASLRMSRRAKESRRLVSPRSWFVRPIAVTRTVRGVIVHDIGCALAELEPTRFWPRRSVDLLADASDVVVVVSGTPAVCHALSRTKTPVVLQVATLVARERRIANSRRRGLAGKYHSLMTWLTSRIDERGLSVPKAVLVENRLMLEECQARMVRWPELCPPGIDTQTFKPGPGGDRSPYILFVARLGDSRKNVSGLLRAFSRARHLGGVTQNLVLAGLSAPSADDLGLVDELGLSSAVEVLSPVTKVELVALYQGADLSHRRRLRRAWASHTWKRCRAGFQLLPPTTPEQRSFSTARRRARWLNWVTIWLKRSRPNSSVGARTIRLGELLAGQPENSQFHDSHPKQPLVHLSMPSRTRKGLGMESPRLIDTWNGAPAQICSDLKRRRHPARGPGLL